VKLLLDEMLSLTIARELRARGHDVLAVAGQPDWAALSDPEVMALARTEHRVIVTSNVRDYRPLHVEAVTPGGQGHFSMIFMSGNYRRTKSDIGRIIEAVVAKLTEYPAKRTWPTASAGCNSNHRQAPLRALVDNRCIA
jgi:hypothetical protein